MSDRYAGLSPADRLEAQRRDEREKVADQSARMNALIRSPEIEAARLRPPSSDPVPLGGGLFFHDGRAAPIAGKAGRPAWPEDGALFWSHFRDAIRYGKLADDAKPADVAAAFRPLGSQDRGIHPNRLRALVRRFGDKRPPTGG